MTGFLPPNQFLQDIGLEPDVSPLTLEFTQWAGALLPPAGTNGVPNQTTEPMAAGTYLSGLRSTLIQQSKARPLIRVTDNNLHVMAELTGEISASIEEIMDDTGKLSITILYSNWIVDWMVHKTQVVADLNIIIDPFPTKPNWRHRWGGKITEIHVKHDDKGVYSVELVALHFREHAKKLLVGANPIFPPEVQLPKMWVMAGPVRTICAITAFINLARIFMPGLSTITNIMNPAGWINPLNANASILPTGWPIQVAFVDPAFDQSRWTAMGGAWTDWHTTFKDILSDAGVVMKAYTYLTTDEDSPNIELANLLTAAPDLLGAFVGVTLPITDMTATSLSAPLRNCVVFSFEDKSGITGPTGTAFDGLLNTVAVTLDDLITPLTIDLQTGNTFDPGGVLDGEPMIEATGIAQTDLIASLLDVAPGPPTVVWWDGTFNGRKTTDVTWHKGAVKTIMTGSKSPVIVNEGLTFLIKYALAELSDLIYGAAPSGLAATALTGNIPGSFGLDNLYQGQLNDVFLAWQRFTDPIRALYTGDVAWQEHFEKGSGTAYTLASILTLRNGDWKSRAWISSNMTVRNHFPWIANYDYFLGDRVGFEQDGIIWVDNVYSIKYSWDWQEHLEVQIRIGEDKMAPDPFGLAFKTMANMYAFVSQLAGEGTLFSG